MMKLSIASICSLPLLAACLHVAPTTELIGDRVQNPRTDWEVSGGGEGLPPRREVYKPNGEAWKDTGDPRDGPATGTVFFGPAASTGTGVGDPQSRATAVIACGGGGGECVVRIVAAGGDSSDHADYEYLVLTISQLDANGLPTGVSQSVEHRGNLPGQVHELRVPGCGNVRVTLTFREDVNDRNPPGIQTSFVSKIQSHECAKAT